MQVSSMNIFFYYFLPNRIPGLVELLTVIDRKWSRWSKMIWGRVDFPSLSTAGRVISFSNLKDAGRKSL